MFIILFWALKIQFLGHGIQMKVKFQIENIYLKAMSEAIHLAPEKTRPDFGLVRRDRWIVWRTF